MVDIVARVVVEEDGSRTLNFKSDEVVFGGGRLRGIKTTKIPLKWAELVKVYDSVAITTPQPAVADNTQETQPAEKRESRLD